jgi:hypothetical protein
MKMSMVLTAALTLGLLNVPSTHAEPMPCEERAQWLTSVPIEGRELILLKISSDSAHKFFEIISRPEASSGDQLWAYKILSFAHYGLSHSPYASPHTKLVLTDVESLSSQMVRGKIDFESFQSKFKAAGGTISEMMLKAQADGGGKFLLSHKAQVDDLSSCIIARAMVLALPPKPKG